MNQKNTADPAKRALSGPGFIEMLENRTMLSAAPVLAQPVNAAVAAVRDAHKVFQAEKADQSRGVRARGWYVTDLGNGDYLAFRKISFSASVRSIQARVAAPAEDNGARIEVRLDRANGPLVGTLRLAGAGSGTTFSVQTAAIKATTGTHSVYLVARGDAAGSRLDRFSFSDQAVAPAAKPKPRPRVAGTDAHVYVDVEKGLVKGGVKNGWYVTNLGAGAYVRLSRLTFTKQMRSFQARIAVPPSQAGSAVEIRLDKPSGALIGTLSLQGSGTGTDFWVQSAPIKATSGTHDVYVVFRSGAPAARLDRVRFSDHAFTRILPLGDSITESRPKHDSYRRFLWRMLEDAGYSVDFTGNRKGVEKGQPADFDFDQDHEGHSGYTTGQILANLKKWMASQPAPNIVLLHVGTNDLLNRPGETAARWEAQIRAALANTSKIIDTLRTRNPNVKIVLAQIIPSMWIPNWMVEEYNAGLVTMGAKKSTARSRIVLVDQYTGFDPTQGVDTFNGLHPSASGEMKIATNFFNALQPILP